MQEKKKNKFRIIYIILLSTFIGHILQFLYVAIFTDIFLLDGCAWNDGSSISLFCEMNVYFQPIGIILASIFSNFIATIISYKLIFNKKVKLIQIDRKKVYITLEILLIIKLLFPLQQLVYPDFIDIIQETGPVATALPIVAVTGLFLISSWLLNKIIFKNT